ncbi:rRNA pseudouridine synthase [Candidatus Saccharibacteria bacterium]|nr:rRNA pseudouridine synthase [Candidatus Saccharibacteria bacterium]
MRLNAFLARAGITSRRKADELIKAGRVTVNGKNGQLNSNVDQNDQVALDGKAVGAQKLRYILINKPTGTVTTLKDPHGRKKIIDLVNISERVVPVGRLDWDTTGALLLTNDGELANQLMHPSFKVNKTYTATVQGELTEDKLNKLRRGVMLDDGPSAPAQVRALTSSKIEIIIHEGRNHLVKRMLGTVDLKVTALHRSIYEELDLTELRPGQWRDLTKKEILQLRMVK